MVSLSNQSGKTVGVVCSRSPFDKLGMSGVGG